MKKLFLILLVYLTIMSFSFAQEQFAINNETPNLKVETEGELDLLSLKTKDTLRLFVRDNYGTLQELLNTQNDDNSFREEFKDVLNKLTKDSGMSMENVGFGRYSLKQFIKAYNSNGTGRFTYTDEKVTAQTRLGLFAGLTNHPFMENPNNGKVTFINAELELFEKKPLPLQSGFISISHALENDDYKFISTTLALGHRFRFVNKTNFNIYTNLNVASYTFSKETITFDESTTVEKNSAFRVPFSLGIGSDIKISENSFISLIYNELFAVFASNSDNFPINFAAGYKFNL
ncbi:autotransporter outer membrane beta-barrel domain-containing protein [Seonamhaeicola maritimus]|uniref:Autotransporter outer membrane beta-barrel domain-containing protein n=1 Tax=Seonamhaeicola maritimus TaxID=2591822 RepID=A0A5C7GGX9_9FLAO|nr:autotransporter outer membrane beta-barrel domain-containing protein [Seonamhaeicola maritimus]TXG36733.1 autotransporter outer membrane beta-barrel domain-containing protein [Seonamhaeicola maritimus]